jgi:two-component system phosphate regulon sensor histidine kinase PhoR
MDKAFNNIAVQAEKMQTLADDLIVLSKLESEGTPEACEPINVSALLYEIVADARELSAGKHRFDIQCDEQLGFQVSAKDLRSTLGNVIFNAVRHNPRGAKIEINVTEEDNHWNVAIRDDGIGIDPIEIPRITERFYRVDASRNSTSGGTGLGLAIVKHTLNRYGGSLVINSRSDEGAEFLCRWPKAR